MNYLMQVEIRGIGTPDVESLPSYIHRLACAHKVSASALLKSVAKWYRLKHPDKNICFNDDRFAGDISVYVRPNQATYDLVTMLSEAIGNPNLFGTTFVSLNKAVVRTQGIFSHKIRWCPYCVKHFESNNDEGYFKLMWTVSSITHCHTHNSLLVDQCPVCKEEQGGYSYKIEPSRCQKCGSSLSLTNENNTEFKLSWNAQGLDMMSIVEYISNNPTYIFPENSIKKVITHEFDKAWSSNTEDELWKIIPKNECIGISEGNIPITIKRARILSHRFGVDISDLLCGDITKSPAMLNPDWSSDLPDDIKPVKRKNTRSQDIILSMVHSAMGSNKDNPKPLRFYSRYAGVSVGYLHYNFKTLSERIISVYLAWKADEKIRKKQEAYDEAIKRIVSHGGAPEKFSKKGALRKIIETTGLPKDVVRKAINDVYKLLL